MQQHSRRRKGPHHPILPSLAEDPAGPEQTAAVPMAVVAQVVEVAVVEAGETHPRQQTLWIRELVE